MQWKKRGEEMKGIFFGLLLVLFVVAVGVGFADNGGKIIDGINEKTVSLDVEGDRMVWADAYQKTIGIYRFSKGKTKTVALQMSPSAVHIANGKIYFLGGNTKPGDLKVYPYYCNSKSSKTYRLDTTPADGLEADGNDIVWYNRDRVMVQNLQTGRRLTFKADQAIRDASVSQNHLVYIDGVDERKNYLRIIDLRTGDKKAYAFMNIGDLAFDYPFVALASAEDSERDGKSFYIVNLETEHVTSIERTHYPALLRSNYRYGLEAARGAVVFCSTMEPNRSSWATAQGIYLYDIDKEKLMNLSSSGIRPALSENRVAWVENGGIYVYKYR